MLPSVLQGNTKQLLDVVLESTNNVIWVETASKEAVEISGEITLISGYIQRELVRNGKGAKQSEAIRLPKPVDKHVLELMGQYSKFHAAPGRSDKERKLFDEKFVRLDTRVLCELTSAADALEMKALVDLTSRALARLIEGKSPEEIRETFNLPDDLTEEEKLEPVKAGMEDPRIRLLNKFYAKKRRELQQRLEGIDQAPEATAEDTRSLEDLLQFIEEPSNGGGKGGKAKKKKSKKALTTEPSTSPVPPNPTHEECSTRDVAASYISLPPPSTPQVYTRLTSLADFRVRRGPGDAAAQDSDVSDGDVLSDEEEDEGPPLDPGTVRATLNRMLEAAGLGEVLEVVFRRPPGALHLAGGFR